MQALYRYLRYAFCYPDKRDFLKRGLGIATRFKRCRRYWTPHLCLCKHFQYDALKNWPGGGSLAILGAGRLLDIDAVFLLKCFEGITLFDADPSVLPTWKRVSRQVEARQEVNFRIEDVTSSISVWTTTLKRFLGCSPANLDRLSQVLCELKTASPDFLKTKYDVIFSVNLLSQISLFWRDRAQRLIERFWRIKPDEMPQEVRQALAGSMQRLSSSHIKALDQSLARLIVLISDTEILTYDPQQTDWDGEPLLPPELLHFENFKTRRRESWLWHLLPAGLEHNELGAIHRVTALELGPCASCLDPGTRKT